MDPSNLHIHGQQGPQGPNEPKTSEPLGKTKGPPQEAQAASTSGVAAQPASISQTNSPSAAAAAAATNVASPQLPSESIKRLSQFSQTMQTGQRSSITQDNKEYIIQKYPDGILIQRKDEFAARQRSGLFVNTSTNSVILKGNPKEIQGVIDQCCPKTPTKPTFTMTDKVKLGLQAFMGPDASRKALEQAFKEVEKASTQESQASSSQKPKGLKKLFGSKQPETIEGRQVQKSQTAIIESLMNNFQLSSCVGQRTGGRVLALYDPHNKGTKPNEVPEKDFLRVVEAYKQLIELQPLMRNIENDWEGTGNKAYSDLVSKIGELKFSGNAEDLATFLEGVVKASHTVAKKHWPDKYADHVEKE